MGRVLKRFLKQHGAYAAAGVAATARGIGEAAGGEGSEDQMFTIALASLFALGRRRPHAHASRVGRTQRDACRRGGERSREGEGEKVGRAAARATDML